MNKQRMDSVVTLKPYTVCIEERDIPVPKKGEALLRAQYGGLCGGDLGIYRGTHFLKTYPLVQGHEFSATIASVEADNGYGLKEGMLVTGLPYYGCGVCPVCRKGFPQCCEQNKTMGALRDGAFQQYFTMPLERVYDCTGLSAIEAAFVEPFVIGYHAVCRPGLREGDKVLVIGAGTIGLVTAVMAKAVGALVTISDVVPQKLETAQNEFGIDTLLNNSETFMDEVMDRTGGHGYDAVLEAVGLPSTFQDSLEAAMIGGKVVSIGVGKKNLDFDFNIIQRKHLDIYGSRNGLAEDFLAVIDMARNGRLGNITKLVTKIYPYKEAAKAFEDMEEKGASVMKNLLQFA